MAIFDDELQPEVDRSVTWNRISNLIGSPIGQKEAMLCQETFNNLDQSHARIAACASCCERLLSTDGQQGIVEMKQADRAYGTEISPTLFVISFVILLYAVSYNICI